MSSIVIIEQDDLMRGLLKEWLAAEGYHVRGCALHEPPLVDGTDLVIVDLYMPRDSGAEAVRAVQHAYPRVPVIAISAQFRAGLDESWRTASALGVRRLMAKPLTRNEVLDAVRALIGPAR
jgi:DNA-binding response OmpR family regulator